MNWNYKINKEKIQYPLTVTQKINNKSPLTVYNYTKNLNKYESTLNYYWITQILYYT
jgi:hypothetical protein